MTNFMLFLFTGIGLAMDAFAVSICKGLSMTKVKHMRAVIIALFFGGFQALMPLLGWLLGTQFDKFITNFDHWVAFGLLFFIGSKMLIEAIREKDEDEDGEIMDKPLDIKELLILAIATSIDALAVGISFACLNYSIGEAVTVIGVVTFLISLVGVYIGNFFGSKYKKKAEIVGGVILVLIGLKVLLEHLGILIA